MESHDIETLTFEAGEVLIAPGSAAGDAFVVLSGSVCIEDAVDAPPLVVGAGELVGDLDLLVGRPHSAAVVALERVAAVRLTRPQLAAALRSGGAGGMPMRDMLTGFARRLTERHAARSAPGRAAPVPASAWVALELAADNAALARQVGRRRLGRRDLPFAVGRKPGRNESAPTRPVSLVVTDNRPYNMSRRHFALDAADGAPIVRDTGSLLGTLVNDMRIGAGRAANVAPLHPGRNLVVAGAVDSPLRFVVTVAAD